MRKNLQECPSELLDRVKSILSSPVCTDILLRRLDTIDYAEICASSECFATKQCAPFLSEEEYREYRRLLKLWKLLDYFLCSTPLSERKVNTPVEPT